MGLFCRRGCCSGSSNSNASLYTATGVSVFLMAFTVFFTLSAGDRNDARADAAAGTSAMTTTPDAEPTNAPVYVLDHTLPLLSGEEQDLAAYEGKVVLMVNTASRCGFTPQYEGLQKLYDEFKDDGLVVLGFPANNFGNQEPGSNEQIAAFCERNFGVEFPMFAKISVTGDDAHPLYQELAQAFGEPRWNFHKYLVDRSGKAVRAFGSRTAPDDDELLDEIRRLLKAQAD
jgi:glutathione peroxidase